MLRQVPRTVSWVAAMVLVGVAAHPAAAERLFERRTRAPAVGACDDARLLEPAAVSVRDSGLDAIRGPCLGSAYLSRVRVRRGDDDSAQSLLVEARFASAAGAELAIGALVLDDPLAGERGGFASEGERGVGPVFVELRRVRDSHLLGAPVSLGPSLRLEVPRTRSQVDVTTVAASPAFQLSFALGKATRLHARAGALLLAALPEDDVATRAALLGGVDLAWRPWSWLGLAVGAEAQGGWLDDGFDHLLPRGAARVALGDFDVELGGAAPLFGDESADFVIALGALLRR